MNLANEAGYLYIYSKELMSLNSKLKSLSKKAEKHAHKHSKTNNESKKLKHKEKHTQVKTRIEKLLKKHNLVMKALKHHHLEFYHELKKEHKLK